jgi:MFS family permease
MADLRSFEIDRTQRRLGPIWLTSGVTPGNALAMFFSGMATIVLLTATGNLLPYLLHEHLKMPVEVQGNFIGNLVLIVEIITLTIVVPIGVISDRVGRRPLFTGGFLLICAGLALLPIVRDEATFIATRIVSAVGMAIGTTMLATTIADYPQNASRGKFISVNGVITNIGVLVLSFLVFGQLPKFFTARGATPYEAGTQTFLTLAAFALLTALVTYVGLRGGQAIAHKSRGFRDIFRTGAAEVRKNRRLQLACASYVVSRADLMVFVMFFALWLVAVGKDAGMATAEAQAMASRLMGLAQLSMLLCTPLIGVLVDHFDRVVALGISMAIAFVGYLAVGIVPDPLNSPLIYGAAILGGAAQAAVVVSGPALVGQEATPAVRGSIIGFVALFGGIGVLVNTKISGVLFDEWMYQAPFVFMAVLNLVICVASFGLRAWEIRTGFVTHATAAAAHKASLALEAKRAAAGGSPPVA